MDTYQFVWMIILMPLFLFFGLVELRRGWKILRYGETSLNVAIRIRIWIVKLFKGEEEAMRFQENFFSDAANMQIQGIYSILGGFIYIAVSIFWLLVLLNTWR